MRWPQAARAGVAVIGLSCAGALILYSRHRPTEPPAKPVAALTDRTVTSQNEGVTGFTFKSAVNDGAVTEIAARLETTYADGRSKWTDVKVKTKKTGHTFDMSADTAETKGKAVNGTDPGEIVVHGHIKVTTDDGLELHTEDATYDSVKGLVTMPGKMTFTRGQLSGESVGATHDRQRDLLSLLDQAHVVQKPDEKGAGAFELTARTIALARKDHIIDMTDQARIVRAEQTLASDHSIIHFTEDEKGVQQIELHGRASVVPGGSAKSNPEMSASDIIMDFQPDGQNLKHATLTQKARLVQPADGGKQVITATTIDLVTAADGKTLVNLNAKENVVMTLPATPQAPGRIITAPSLVGSGDEKAGLTAALFEGGVQFTETPLAGRGRGAAPASRKGTSTRLILDLGGQLGAITKAEFREKVVFTDGPMRATADIANYEEAKGLMLLTPAKGSTVPPSVDDGSVNVDAWEFIRIDMATHDLRARDRVRTRMTAASSANGIHTPALFDAKLPVLATATEMKYVSQTKSASFAGSAATQAMVYQDPENSIRGDRVDVEQDSGNLTATGKVTSSFMLETPADTSPASKPAAARPAPASPAGTRPAAAAKKPAPSVGEADRLEYRDANRTAVYVGSAEKLATLKSTGFVEGERIVLTLAAEGRSLEKLEAAKTVYATFEDGHEAVAAKLVYEAAADKYTLTGMAGAPVLFKTFQDKDGPRTCSYETTTDLTYEIKTQSMQIPGGRPLKATTPMACDAKLKTFRKNEK